MIMTFVIIIAVILGIFVGKLFVDPSAVALIDHVTTYTLILLLFSVGIELGSNRETFKNVKSKSFKLIVLTLSVIVGTFVGGLLAGVIVKLNYNTSLAISAGFGWYSLSAVILKEIASPEVAAIAFLTNVIREILAVISIPILAKYLNHLSALAPGGATSMDTTLPIISNATDSNHAMIAFLHGAFLSFLVPFLVPALYLLNF